ncbi:MAG: response regulator [Candidatus Omnitrophota bacterium]
MIYKKKILVIDNESEFAELIKNILEDTGRYEVITCNSGEIGIKEAEDEDPALILLDIMMPGMDGPDVARKMKENYRTKNIPVVFLTAAITEEEVRGQEGDIGGRIFLSKPVKIKELIDCVEKNVS